MSSDNPQHDIKVKRAGYAKASIPETGSSIQRETITMLQLEGDTYREHGRFARGETTSALLNAFAILVDIALAAR